MESQQPINPYAPPTTDPQAASMTDAGGPVLASRWRRLGGWTLDLLLGAIASAPIYQGLSFGQLASQGQNMNPFRPYVAAGVWGIVAAVTGLALMAVHAVLVTKRGQTVGKILVGTRIVSCSGALPGFTHGVLLRTWLTAAVAMVPVVGWLASLIDVLFIFRSDKRCLHDLIAGTRVVLVDRNA